MPLRSGRHGEYFHRGSGFHVRKYGREDGHSIPAAFQSVELSARDFAGGRIFQRRSESRFAERDVGRRGVRWFASPLGPIGYRMRKFEFPLAPVILGLVLGNLLEQSIRRALMISGGEVGILFQSAIAKTLFGLAIFVVVAPKLMQNLRAWNRRGKS